jgi:hypothetical protein
MVRVARKLPLLFPYNTEAMSVDSGRQRLRPNSRLLIAEQAMRLQRKGYELV